jgi:hypothetical protein
MSVDMVNRHLESPHQFPLFRKSVPRSSDGRRLRYTSGRHSLRRERAVANENVVQRSDDSRLEPAADRSSLRSVMSPFSSFFPDVARPPDPRLTIGPACIHRPIRLAASRAYHAPARRASC